MACEPTAWPCSNPHHDGRAMSKALTCSIASLARVWSWACRQIHKPRGQQQAPPRGLVLQSSSLNKLEALAVRVKPVAVPKEILTAAQRSLGMRELALLLICPSQTSAFVAGRLAFQAGTLSRSIAFFGIEPAFRKRNPTCATAEPDFKRRGKPQTKQNRHYGI